MTKKHELSPQEDGFTLVELSIVLVIIGLIVGGVLVGQDMIKAAEIRSTVSQIEQYNSASNVFRDKYAGMPGDIRNMTTYFATATNGDGNGFLTDGDAAANDATDYTNGSGEIVNYFAHLSDAQLIGITYIGGADGSATPLAQDGTGNFPYISVGERAGIMPMMVNGRMHWHLGVAEADYSGGGAITYTNIALTPNEASQLDEKLDNGRADTGVVTARIGATAAAIAAAPTAGAGACTFTVGTTDVYNTVDTNNVADTPLCQLRIRGN